MTRMVLRALVIWTALLAGAILNGAVRETWLTPKFGTGPGHAISSITLSCLILLIAWVALPWIHPRTRQEAWAVGWEWLTLTVAFEFLAGHFLFGRDWAFLLADYNLAAGRIWLIVLLVTLTAPALVFKS